MIVNDEQIYFFNTCLHLIKKESIKDASKPLTQRVMMMPIDERISISYYRLL